MEFDPEISFYLVLSTFMALASYKRFKKIQ